MNAIKQQKNHPFTWLAIRGFKDMDTRVVGLADTAWMIAYTALWHAEMISEEEKRRCMALIKTYLLDAPDPQDAYNDMIQRILLAREYVMQQEGRWIPAPAEWFDHGNPHGFAGTERWLQRVKEKRRAYPLYRQALRAFAEAIQEIKETGDAKDFHYWRSYFAERRWNRLLNLLLATVGNMRFNN